MDEQATLAGIRRLVLLILIMGVGGMGAELLLLGHVDGALQIAPVVLLGAGLLTLVWQALAPGVGSVRAVQAMMALFVLSGALGIALHCRGNVEFELEMSPSLSGLELLRKTLTGATPVLAPGSMTLLGLIGLVQTYRHPRRRGRGAVPPQER